MWIEEVGRLHIVRCSAGGVQQILPNSIIHFIFQLLHPMELHNIEDEIEYFELLPLSFTTELQKDLEEALTDVLQSHHAHHKVQTHVLGSFKRNLFIFSNFVLRNILRFPANFKLERKITDKFIQADVGEMINKMIERQLQVQDLRRQIAAMEEKVRRETDRNNGYRSLLENKAYFNDMCTGAKEIKKFLKETGSLYERYKSSCPRRDNEFDRLMEYKNIKSEYYRNERDKLLEVADFDILEHINKSIS